MYVILREMVKFVAVGEKHTGVPKSS